MEKRKYHNDMLSMIGFGGIIVSGESQADANYFVDEAIDGGINYFDVAPSYGNAEERLGPAIEGKRSGIFLACKTEKRSAKESLAALENSLRVLKTDAFDLYQLHAVASMDDVEEVFAPSGAMETLVKAKKDGKIKHLGFSAHSEEAALALMERFDFDSVLMPINWLSLLQKDFGKKVLETAQAKGVERLALKAMAKGKLSDNSPNRPYPKCWYEPISDEAHADLALRFTLSQPITAAIPPGDIRLFRLAIKIANNYKPLTDEEISRLSSYSAEPVF